LPRDKSENKEKKGRNAGYEKKVKKRETHERAESKERTVQVERSQGFVYRKHLGQSKCARVTHMCPLNAKKGKKTRQNTRTKHKVTNREKDTKREKENTRGGGETRCDVWVGEKIFPYS